MNTYEWLVGRLDAFIRKYYTNKVIRGSLVFLSCLLAYVLTVSVSEYYFFLPVWLRVSILALFVGLGGLALVAWVIIPLTKVARLGRIISHEQAATIIGEHFPEVSDRLLNILQLKKHTDNSSSRELAEASINQKISQISVVPISGAIDFSRNRKYLPFLLPLLAIGTFILIAAPNVFKESTTRLLQPTKTFEKPAPFKFVIHNPALLAIRNADFVLSMSTTGAALPAEVAIEIGGERIPMQAMNDHHFQYTFRGITEQVEFRFWAAGFHSATHTLKVVQRPVLQSFQIRMDYPAYTGKKSETRTSLSDMAVPAGTQVGWAFSTRHTDAATIRLGSSTTSFPLQRSGNDYSYKYRFLADTSYTITLHNRAGGIADSYQYQVQVIPDQYPVVQTQQFRDSTSGKQILITGTAGDDYGINRVLFHYEVSDKNRVVASKSVPVRSGGGALAAFQHYFDIHSLNLQPGQKLTYFIEAWDNDGVHGSKASRSEIMSYFMYDESQIDSAISENARQINSSLSNSAQKSKQLQAQYKEMQSKMMQSDGMEWQQQQTLEEMLKKQMELKNQVESIKQKFEEQMQQSEQKKISEDLKDKQKELDKQLDNLLNEELKKQMKKLQELMQKLNKENALETMKQLEQDNKLFKMDMERMQELMKKLEMQMRMEDMAGKMDELAKKQEQLKNETDKADKQGDNNKDKEDGNKNNDKETKNDKNGKDQKDAGKDKKDGKEKDSKELAKEQKELKEQLEKAMKEDLKELQKMAKDAKQNDQMENEQQQAKDAEQDMKESEEELQKEQKSKSSKAQKEAIDNLKSMAKSLKKKANDMDAEQIEIDIRATRQILSNLIRLSFDQEDVLEKVRKTPSSSQAYVANQEEQNRLHKNSMMIRDSLFALSKRIEKLPAVVNKETTQLEQNMRRAVNALEARNINAAVTDQQYVMTHTNNLALMLNEILANLMQMESEAKKPGGEGSCSKPNGKKPQDGPGTQLGDIITKQKQLGEAMQKMQGKGKKPGEKPGDKEGKGKTPGQKPGEGQGKSGGQNGQEGDAEGEYGDAEQLARLAEQQASIRRKMQELNSLLNSKGLGNSKEMRELEQQMDKTETDLVNRKLGTEMIQRQKEILTRLLEAEKSLREQEQDDKRSSQDAKDISRPIPAALQKYITDQKQLLELYKTVPPQLKPYYRDMVEQYFHIIGTK